MLTSVLITSLGFVRNLWGKESEPMYIQRGGQMKGHDQKSKKDMTEPSDRSMSKSNEGHAESERRT